MIRPTFFAAGLTAVAVIGAGSWAILSERAPRVARLDVPSQQMNRTNALYPVRFALPPARSVQLGDFELSRLAASSEATDKFGSPDEGAQGKVSATPGFSAIPRSNSGLLDVRFDISTFGMGAGANGDRAVLVQKPLVLSGDRLGTVELALGQGSIVSVDRQSLQTLVAGKNEELIAALAGFQSERVTFDELRDRGIGIRYDPLADAVVIAGRS